MRWCFAGLALAACSSPGSIFLPREPDAQSLILAFTIDGDVKMTAGPLGDVDRLALPGEPTNLTALFYRATLEELELDPGTFATSPTARGRELPTPLASFVESSGEWEAIRELPPALDAVRLPAFSAPRCAAKQGCYLNTPLDRDSLCTIPCPEPTDPIDPRPPAPPDFSRCPGTWMHAGAVCSPPALVHPQICMGATAQFIDTSSCAAIGDPCSVAGPFGDALPPGVVYVLAGAAPGGDGTRARPYATISEAGGAEAIALGEGEYDGPGTMSSTRIIGACSLRTTIRSFEVGAGANVAVENTRIAGGIRVAGGAILELDGVLVDGAQGSGLQVIDGGTLRARSLVVRDTGAFAVYVGNATIELDRVVIERGVEIGIAADGVATPSAIRDLVVRDMVGDQRADTEFGEGMQVLGSGASMLVERALFERCRSRAVSFGAAGELRDVIARDTTRDSPDASAIGIALFGPSTATVERAFVEGSEAIGFYVATEATAVHVSDLVLRNVRSGIGLELASRAHFERVRIEDSAFPGISFYEVSETATVTDLSIAGGRGQDSAISIDGRRGFFRFARTSIEDAPEIGVRLEQDIAEPAPARVTFEDLSIARTAVEGIVASFSSSSYFERVRVDDSGDVAFRIQGSAAADVFDLAIHGAPGISAEEGARAGVRRFAITDSAGIGVQVFGGPERMPTRLNLRDGEIARHMTGALIFADPFAAETLLERVVYRDNATLIGEQKSR